MNERQGKRSGAAILVLLAWLAPFAVSESRAETQLYDIELVVFRNLVENDGGEVWPLEDRVWEETGVQEPDDVSGPEVTWLSEPYRLAAHYEALRRSAQYRPLAHFAWRQPVVDRDQALHHLEAAAEAFSVPCVTISAVTGAAVDSLLRQVFTLNDAALEDET